MKLIKPLSLLVICLVLIVGLAPQSAMAAVPDLHAEISELNSPKAKLTDSLTGTNTTYIPCVFFKFCPSNKPSPFSIQIAGLSDFTPPPDMTKAQLDQLRVQEYADLTAVFPTLVDALRESGAGTARVYLDWANIQPVDAAHFNWSTYDNWISQVAAAGVKMIGTVANPPSWAIDTFASPCTNKIRAQNLPDFYNFLTALVNRYKTTPYGIQSWEILNEPDAIDGYRCDTGVNNYGQHGADYAALLEGAYPVVKAADPSAKVIMGGMAYDYFYLPETTPPTIDYLNGDGSAGGQFNRFFIDDVVTNGGANFADGVNIHYFNDFAAEWERWTVGNLPTCGDHTLRDPNAPPYATYGKDVIAKGTHFLNRLKTCYGVEKPLYISEVGMHGTADQTILQTRPNITLDNQARYVFMVYARGLSLGAENITWYALKIIPSITSDDYQGLLYDSRDGILENQPKPAFYAYKTLTHELTGFQYSSTPTAPTDVEAFVFTNSCQTVKTIAWYNQPTGSAPFNLGSANKVRLVYRPDANGSDHIVTFNDGDPTYDLDGEVNGQVTIALTVEPVIIQINP